MGWCYANLVPSIFINRITGADLASVIVKREGSPSLVRGLDDLAFI